MAAAENKTSFVFHQSYYEALKLMDDATFRACFDALCEYAFDGVEPETSNNPMIYIFMTMARPTLDAAAKRYAASVENGKKGAKYGILGGRPRKKKTPITIIINDDEDENEVIDIYNAASIKEISDTNEEES